MNNFTRAVTNSFSTKQTSWEKQRPNSTPSVERMTYYCKRNKIDLILSKFGIKCESLL